MSSKFILDRAKAVFDPYGFRGLPTHSGPMAISKEEDDENGISVKRLFLGCEWFQIYDLIEDLFAQMFFYEDEFASIAEEFQSPRVQTEMNVFFKHAGIGWQVKDGKVVSREQEALEGAERDASASLVAAGRVTCDGHLKEAFAALSRRPEPNTSGAVFHAMGAL